MSTASNDISSAGQLHFIMSGVVASIICIAGIAGNSLNIVVLLSLMKKSASSTYTMLLALAVADLCVMTVFTTAAFTLFARHPPITHPTDMPPDASNFHVLLYYTWPIAANTAACASNWFVAVLTLHRYLVVHFPMKMGSWCSLRKVRFTIIVVCAFSAALVLPDSMTVGFKFENSTLIGYDTSLYADETYNAVYYTVQTCLIHLVPYACNSILTVLLIRTLRRARRALVESTSEDCQALELDQRRISVMLVVLVASSLVLTLPSCSYRVARDFFGDSGRLDENRPSFIVFRAVCDVLELSSYALNFYLFCICNPTYRSKFVAIVTCRESLRTSLCQAHRSVATQEDSTLFMNVDCAGSEISIHELGPAART